MNFQFETKTRRKEIIPFKMQVASAATLPNISPKCETKWFDAVALSPGEQTSDVVWQQRRQFFYIFILLFAKTNCASDFWAKSDENIF